MVKQFMEEYYWPLLNGMVVAKQIIKAFQEGDA
jgi:hypothetical protein